MPIYQPLRRGTAHSLRRFFTSFAIFTLFLGLFSCTGDSETETPEGCNAVCAQRECGIDTTCQVDCGGCSTGTCSDAGQCVKTLSRAAAMASWSRASSATGLKLEMLPAKVRASPEVPSTVMPPAMVLIRHLVPIRAAHRTAPVLSAAGPTLR